MFRNINETSSNNTEKQNFRKNNSVSDMYIFLKFI